MLRFLGVNELNVVQIYIFWGKKSFLLMPLKPFPIFILVEHIPES